MFLAVWAQIIKSNLLYPIFFSSQLSINHQVHHKVSVLIIWVNVYKSVQHNTWLMVISTLKHFVWPEPQNNEIDFIKFYLYSSSIDDETEVHRRWYLLTITKLVNEEFGVIMHDITEKWGKKGCMAFGVRDPVLNTTLTSYWLHDLEQLSTGVGSSCLKFVRIK